MKFLGGGKKTRFLGGEGGDKNLVYQCFYYKYYPIDVVNHFFLYRKVTIWQQWAYTATQNFLSTQEY